MLINVSAECNVGRIRENNEDNYYVNGHIREDVSKHIDSFQCTFSEDHALFAVCDGMGGEEYGEIASLIAVENLKFPGEGSLRDYALSDCKMINDKIVHEAQRRGNARVGCTIASLYLDRGKAFALNVGDSRIYLFRQGNLELLTKDHTENRNLVDIGILTEEQSRKRGGGNKLTQYLGLPEDEMVIEPHFSNDITLCNGDRFLLCSDGVTDMIDREGITDILNGSPSSGIAVGRLEDKVVRAGAKDNFTIIVADIVESADMAKQSFFSKRMNKRQMRL